MCCLYIKQDIKVIGIHLFLVQGVHVFKNHDLSMVAFAGESNSKPPDPPNPCPSGFQHYNEDCYKYATGSSRTWQEGEDHCQEDEYEGNVGHIASVLSPYEQGYMFSELYDWKGNVQDDSQVWIGLTDQEVSNSCMFYLSLLSLFSPYSIS